MLRRGLTFTTWGPVRAAIARLLGGPPVVVHIRDVPFTPSEKLIWRFLATVATRMFVVSRACWPWKRLPANIKIVHNGIATPEGPLPPRALSSPLTIGFVGRLHPFKGLHLLVDWLAEGRERGLDLRLVVRGKARDGEEAYVTEVEKTVAARHLESYCRFEGQRSGLNDIYRGLDVVAVPSSVPDPFPRAVMEALSLGIPVVGYPAGGIPDMIHDRETGYLVTSADTFVEAIADLTGTVVTLDGRMFFPDVSIHADEATADDEIDGVDVVPLQKLADAGDVPRVAGLDDERAALLARHGTVAANLNKRPHLLARNESGRAIDLGEALVGVAPRRTGRLRIHADTMQSAGHSATHRGESKKPTHSLHVEASIT